MTPERWQQVKALFQTAVEGEAHQRAAFLDEACAGDPALRKQVEALIASHEQEPSFMESPGFEVMATSLTQDDGESLVGQNIGPYEVLREIGRGGMGEVYLALDTKLKRQVAIKVLPRAFAYDLERGGRLRREAQLLASLNHPNIAAIYGLEESDGVSYLVMELVPGETLAERLGDSRLSVEEALRICGQIAEALEAAHEKGIIHRDLKPANIKVTPEGKVKVLDFGLAKVLAGDGAGIDLSRVPTDSAATTIEGQILGTPAYMSPEQVRGKPADRRTDIWSFGCVFYETLAGRQAFAGESISDTIAMVLEHQPDWNALPEATPASIRVLLKRCLERDPHRRLHDIADARIEIEDALTSPADVVHTGSVGRNNLSGFRSSNGRTSPSALLRRGVVAAAAAVLALAIALAYWLSSGRRIDSLAVLPFVAADPNAEYLSDGITESLITSLSRLPALRVKSRDSVSRYKRQEKDPETAGLELGVRAVLKGRLLLRGDALSISAELIDARDGAILWRDRYDRQVQDILAIQAEIFREISERLRPRLTGEDQIRLAKPQTENTEAYQLYIMGRYRWNRRTEETLRSSADYFQQAIEKDPNYALAWAGLADAHNLLATYGVLPPAETYPRARTAAMHALELDANLAEAHAALGWQKSQYEWDWSGAEREYRRAMELNPEYATAHHWYAWYLAIVGRLGEAVESILRARDLDPVSPVIHSRVGLFLYFAGRYEQAVQECRKSIEMDPTFAWGRNSLGSVYIETGRYADGIAELEKGLTLAQRGVIEIGYLGHAYAVAGRRAEARKLLVELKDRSTKRYVPLMYLAVIHGALGENTAAFEWLEKAYAERSIQSWYLPDHRLDRLRPDPRFQDLLRRMGLPATEPRKIR